MKLFALYVIIVFLIVSCKQENIIVAENGLSNSDSIFKTNQVELVFESTKNFPNNTQVAIAFIEKGNVVFGGIVRKNDTLHYSCNSNKVFEIGSLTKVFTSTLLANLVIAGELQLDNKINDYLHFPIYKNTPITFKELANHTSGLPREPSNMFWSSVFNPTNPFDNYDEGKLKDYLMNDLELNKSGYSRFKYSNLGAGLLGYVLCKLKNKNYENLLQEYIFDKYGMTNTTTKLKKVKDKIVRGIDENGNETENWVWDYSSLVAAGGILSNTEDLSKFVLAQFDVKNKDLELTRQISYADSSTGVPKMKGIGLGWIILNVDNNEFLFWHNGGTNGYKSSIAYSTRSKTGVIVLSNVSAKHKNNGNIDQLCFNLLSTID